MASETIINFHGIGQPHAWVDDAERLYWIDEDMFRDVLDMIVARRGKQHIAITFDDGNESDALKACPALVERDLTARFFVLSGRIGRAGYLSMEQLRSLAARAMTVGLHGADHVDWRKAGAEELHQETVTAREIIADAVGLPVDEVAIPFGAYDARVIRHLRRAGFRRIHTSDGGRSRIGSVFASRTSIRRDMQLSDVAGILDDSVPVRRRVRRSLSAFARRHVV